MTRAGIPLVTGAAGFAGSHLLERLAFSHDAVAAWSNPGSARARLAENGVHWDAVDLLNPSALRTALERVRPSVIFHCAGFAHVAASWAKAATSLRVNAFGTHLLLDAVSDCGLRCPVVVAGSALVYRPAERPLKEDDPLGPSDPYGVSKLAQEMVGMRSASRVILTRPFNHAGPRQSRSYVTSSFARQIAEIEAGRQAPVLQVGNLDARRDITDVRDTVRAYELLSRSGQPSRPYNICSGVAYRVGDLLEKLLGMAHLAVTVKQDPTRMRPSDNPIVVGDASRVHAETGWRAEIPIDRTLADLLNWWREQLGGQAGRGR